MDTNKPTEAGTPWASDTPQDDLDFNDRRPPSNNGDGGLINGEGNSIGDGGSGNGSGHHYGYGDPFGR